MQTASLPLLGLRLWTFGSRLQGCLSSGHFWIDFCAHRIFPPHLHPAREIQELSILPAHRNRARTPSFYPAKSHRRWRWADGPLERHGPRDHRRPSSATGSGSFRRSHCRRLTFSTFPSRPLRTGSSSPTPFSRPRAVSIPNSLPLQPEVLDSIAPTPPSAPCLPRRHLFHHVRNISCPRRPPTRRILTRRRRAPSPSRRAPKPKSSSSSTSSSNRHSSRHRRPTPRQSGRPAPRLRYRTSPGRWRTPTRAMIARRRGQPPPCLLDRKPRAPATSTWSRNRSSG